MINNCLSNPVLPKLGETDPKEGGSSLGCNWGLLNSNKGVVCNTTNREALSGVIFTKVP